MRDDRNAMDPRSLINRDADFHLNNWAIWNERYRPNIGFNKSSAVVRNYTSSTTFDEMVESRDAQDAEVCDAVIESLMPVERAAIYNVYLRSVFRFRDDPLKMFVTAVERFWELAQRRGLA